MLVSSMPESMGWDNKGILTICENTIMSRKGGTSKVTDVG